MLTAVEGDGEAPGATRTATTADGSQQVERLQVAEPAENRYAYVMESTAMPVTDYVAQLSAIPAGRSTATVRWDVDFEVTSGMKLADMWDIELSWDGRICKAHGVAMHSDQIDINLDMVRQLVDEQFPRWRSLPIHQVDVSGTENALFRIGDQLGARFPLRPGDVASTRQEIKREAKAAQTLLGWTPFPTPEPVAFGEPGAGFPLPWSVQSWLPGTTANDADPSGSVPFARDLAAFIRGVRSIDTGGRTFSGSRRGGDLRDHKDWMETCFNSSGHLLDVPALRRLWAAFRELPPPTSGDVMSHGDLIPGNVLVAHGRLAGILDVGSLAPADPALDLVGAWHLLNDAPRTALRADLGCDDIEWERGKAWAFEQSMGVVWYYVDTNPAMSQMGLRTLERLIANTSV